MNKEIKEYLERFVELRDLVQGCESKAAVMKLERKEVSNRISDVFHLFGHPCGCVICGRAEGGHYRMMISNKKKELIGDHKFKSRILLRCNVIKKNGKIYHIDDEIVGSFPFVKMNDKYNTEYALCADSWVGSIYIKKTSDREYRLLSGAPKGTPKIETEMLTIAEVPFEVLVTMVKSDAFVSFLKQYIKDAESFTKYYRESDEKAGKILKILGRK